MEMPVPSFADPQQNQLLAALPARDFAHILPHLERVSLSPGETLYDSCIPVHHVYFPTDSVISLFYVLEDGASAEFAVVGRDGVVGMSLFMGGDSTPSRAVVQCAGHAYRLTGRILKEELKRVGGRRSGALHSLLLRYAQALFTQMAQTAVCNRHHSLDQQVCRWLLLFLDRMSSNKLAITHGLIASMLGVRREGVTVAAGTLRRAGLIEYHRGHITVLDRAGLEARTCECYAVVREESDRLLEGSPATEIAARPHIRPAFPVGVTLPPVSAARSLARTSHSSQSCVTSNRSRTSASFHNAR